jgi:hypothetical protein
MSEDNPGFKGPLDGLDESRRATLKRLIGTGAFVAPVVVSFAMADLSIDAFMHAAAANITTTTTTSAPGTTTTTTAAPGATTTTTPPPGHPAKS